MLNSFKDKALWAADLADGNGGSKKAQILAVALLDQNGSPVIKTRIGEKVSLKIWYRKNIAGPVHVHAVIRNRFNQIIFGGGTYTLGIDVSSVKPGELAVFELVMDCAVEVGEYMFLVKIAEETTHPNRGVEIDASPWLGPLTVCWDYDHQRAPFFGMFGLPCRGKLS